MLDQHSRQLFEADHERAYHAAGQGCYLISDFIMPVLFRFAAE